MRIWVSIVLVSTLSFMNLALPALAQVINGESTYEDNFAHAPPAPDRPSQTDAGPGTNPDPARTPARDLHERDGK